MLKNIFTQRRSVANALSQQVNEINGLATNVAGQKKFTVAIEGNIGSGKTTLLQYFSKYPDVETVQEPVDRWRNVKNHNLLGLMYKDPSRWSLTFQTYVQLTMLDIHTKIQTSPGKLMERSIYSAKYCFVENLYKSGKMPEAEYIVLTEWFDWLLANANIHLDLIVYLQTKPEVVYERIKKRCREEEQCIPLDYLKNLHDLHEQWLGGSSSFCIPSPVLILDGNKELNALHELLSSNTATILCRTRII